MASAAVELSADKITLEVDYANFNNEDLKVISVSTNPFTITNKETNNITVTVSTANLLTGYTGESKEITIPTNTTSSPITLSLKVPHKEGPDEKIIGTIVVSQGNTQLDTAQLAQVTKPMLEMTELKVEYTGKDGNSERDALGTDTENEVKLDKSVRPGTEVTLTFKLENLFDNDYEDNGEITDITLQISPDDDQLFAEDFEEDYDLDSMDADSKQEFVVSFLTSEDADASEYNLDLTLEGEDGKGIVYKLEKKLNLNIRRERDDVRITSAKITPENISCDPQFSLDLKIKNFGTNDQKYAGISIFNQQLAINENIPNIQLEKYSDEDNNYWRKVFTYTLKNSTAPGKYTFEVKAYINQDELVAQELVDLQVDKCVETTAPAETPSPDTSVPPVQPPSENKATNSGSTASTTLQTPATPLPKTNVTPAPLTSSTILQTVENPYTGQDFFVAMIIVGAVLLLALIVIFFLILMR